MVRRAREGKPTTACGMRVGVFESWNGFISEISPALVRVADVFRQLPDLPAIVRLHESLPTDSGTPLTSPSAAASMNLYCA
jgi:hypothetical protein